METVLAPDLGSSTRFPSDKAQTTFARDAPHITRYSLADSTMERNASIQDYHIQIVTSGDELRVLKFLRRFFFRDEPLNQSIELIPEGEDSTCLELEEYCCASSFENNLSVMAVSTSGAIIGVELNGELGIPGDEEPEHIRTCKNPKFKKILKLLNHVDKNVNRNGDYHGLNVFEVKIISVDSTWRGKGVAKALMEKSIEIARDRGFHLMRADCTSLFSGKLCARMGFEPRYEMKFEDYVDEDGNPIFMPASPHTSVVTYIRKL